MRLTAKQIAVIKQKTALIFGGDAHVYLFGSRIRGLMKMPRVETSIYLSN
jgi:predicted nucleotidyltransferase